MSEQIQSLQQVTASGALVDALKQHKQLFDEAHFVTLKNAEPATEENVNNKDELGLTYMHRAVIRGDIEGVEMLFKLKSSAGRVDKAGLTPLHYAVLTNRLDLVKLLLSSKADVNTKDTNKRSSLHFATISPEVFEYLLTLNGVDIHVRDADEWMPIHFAAAFGSVAVVEMLVKRGAKLDARQSHGLRPIHVAAVHSQLSMIEYLVRSCNESLEATSKDGWTVLHFACVNANVETVEGVLSLGALPCAKNGTGLTALHLAAAVSELEIVKTLVEVGKCDLNALDGANRNALHYAVSSIDREPIIQYLIDKGIDTSQKDDSGFTPLQLRQSPSQGWSSWCIIL